MLQLKKVQILGFKSFCDRTEVQLSGTGIAAVVGPNGCGKSNISDAITWVLGEQSAKSLRGIKMEDVIFAGTRERRPTGMAEVTLTLIDPEVYDTTPDEQVQQHSRDLELAGDWDETEVRSQAAQETEDATAEAQPGPIVEGDEVEAVDADAKASAQAAEAEPAEGQAEASAANGNVVLRVRRRKFNRRPVKAGEIVVTRRLFRSGESEYLLNGKLCRLRDIQDIFFGTGLGGESYAIIGQERIGQLLSSKPLDRRGIIEEAAGITRFKTKKRLAELRLESARQNLSRVNDIFEEVTRQLAILKRQAAKAERYGELRTELQTKLRVVLASRLAQMDADTSATSVELERLGKRIDEGAQVLEAADAEHTAGVSRGYEVDGLLRNAQGRVTASSLELERTRARIDGNRDRIADLEQRATAASADIAGVREQAQTLAVEREQGKRFLETATEEANAHRSDAQAKAAEAQNAAREVQQAEQNTENARRNASAAMQRGHAASNEIAQAEAALAGFDREKERLQAESDAARRELESMGQQRGQAKLTFEDINGRLKRLEGELAESRHRAEQLRSEEQQARQKGNQLRAELAQLTGRRNSLDQLIREHSYTTDTVKNLFRADAKKNNSMQAVGTLADFLEVEGRFENVVDEFLRDELNFIVVRDWSGAEAGVKLLQGEVNGRATFLVADATATVKAQAAEARTMPEGVVSLRDSIRGGSSKGVNLDAELSALLPKLSLGYACPSTDVARELSLQHAECFFLAPSGEVFHRSTVTGGKPRTQGPLALKRELGELQGKIADVDAKIKANEASVAEGSRELTEINGQMEGKNHERRDAERESANLGAALRGLESEAQRLERRLQEWQLSLSRNQDQRRGREETIARKREEAARFSQEREALEAQVAELTETIGTLRARREQLQQAASAANAALAGLEERRRNAGANFQRTENLYNGLKQREQQLIGQIAGFGAERTRREEESLSLEIQLEQLSTDRSSAAEEVAQLTSEAAKLRETVAALDAQLRSLRASLDTQRDQRSNYQARAARLAADLEHLQQACINDLSLEPDALRADRTIQHIASDALLIEEETVRSLRKRMEAMGPVNMMALEEHRETSERHVFLEGQRRDLLEAIENTTSAIREIDEVSQLKFDEAFGIINQNFSDTFSKLFGGGQAFMRLTDPEQNSKGKDSDLNGIDIIASPPGKKLQNVLLLSGGEKALTALSLLVGIFQFQPAPFCVLDEVDAPLDETNVGRFARLIADMSETTQFIVITHSKRTMEQADIMFGVTMQEPGVSKIVSVSLGGRSKGREARSAA